MTFKDLNITEPILKAIEEKGYTIEQVDEMLNKKSGVFRSFRSFIRF